MCDNAADGDTDRQHDPYESAMLSRQHKNIHPLIRAHFIN